MILEALCLLYLVIISICDIRTKRIPDILTAIFFFILLFSDILSSPSSISGKILCGLFFFVLFFITAMFSKGLGMGDIKLAAVIGYCIGYLETSVVFICACATGIVFCFIVYLFRKKKIILPFAPFVTAGYVIEQVVSKRIL